MDLDGSGDTFMPLFVTAGVFHSDVAYFGEFKSSGDWLGEEYSSLHTPRIVDDNIC